MNARRLAPLTFAAVLLATSMADCMMMLGHNEAAKSRYETAIQILKVRAPDDDPRHVSSSPSTWPRLARRHGNSPSPSTRG